MLDAIHRTGSFAAAARELHRVPSAVSYAVQTLEETLGFSLFDRATHKPTLTTAGRWSYHPQLITRRDTPPGRAGQLLIELLRTPPEDRQEI